MDVERLLRSHPATFSAPILAKAAEMLPPGPGLALDPLAGVGKGLDLLEAAGYKAIGWEMEREWASQDPRIRCGDFLDNDLAPWSVDLIFTSPAYGNRMADNYAGSPSDLEHLLRTGTIRRRSYRIFLGRPLSAGNGAALQWGPGYRSLHARLWKEANRVLRSGGYFLLNASNHERDHEVQRVLEWHVDHLTRVCDLKLVQIEAVQTHRYRDGANRQAREDNEYLILLRKP